MKVCGETMLANAIILTAVNDYRTALNGKKIQYHNVIPEYVIDDVEKFFLSDFFKVLTNINGESLINQLRKEFENKGYHKSKIEYE